MTLLLSVRNLRTRGRQCSSQRVGIPADVLLRPPDDTRHQSLAKLDWRRFPLKTMAVLDLAQALHVHPAIVAGRVRYERRNYRLLSQFVGTGVVRQQFR